MFNFFLNQTKKKQYILLLVDVFLITVAIVLAYAIRHYINGEVFTIDSILAKLDIRHATIIIAYIFSLYIFSQYNFNHIGKISNISKILPISIAVGLILNSSIFFYYPKYIFGRTVLTIHFALILILVTLWHLFFVKFLLKGGNFKRILVIGDREQITKFLNDICQHFESGYKVIGTYFREKNGFISSNENESEYIKDIDSILSLETYDFLLYDTKCRFFSSKDIESILKLKYKGKTIYDIPTFYQDAIGKAPIEFIDNIWMLFNTQLQRRQKQNYVRVKRIIDLSLSLSMVILFSPLMFLICLAIKLTSKGPIIFKQERMCLQGRKFFCYKFRTMQVQHQKTEQIDAKWATSESDRITKLGSFLRKTRLDELPQLLNILKGEMSFVGPRPIREQFAFQLSNIIPFYNLRFMVKPGLSGWAQVNLDYADSYEKQLEKFKYELFYLQNMSFILDILIIVKTIQKVFRGEGT